MARKNPTGKIRKYSAGRPQGTTPRFRPEERVQHMFGRIGRVTSTADQGEKGTVRVHWNGERPGATSEVPANELHSIAEEA